MGLGEGSYVYAITGAGINRAREALDRSQYAGPAPVPLRCIQRFNSKTRPRSYSGYQSINASGIITSGD